MVEKLYIFGTKERKINGFIKTMKNMKFIKCYLKLKLLNITREESLKIILEKIF